MDIGRLIETVIGQNQQPSGKTQDTGEDIGSLIPGGTLGKLGLLALLLGTTTGGGRSPLLMAGGLAVLGTMAYKAYQNWQASQHGQSSSTAPLPPASAGSITDTRSGKEQLNLIRAMISAAKADGHLDNAEMTKIQQAITGHDLDGTAKSFLFDALSEASDAASVAKLAENEQQACEIYVASRLVIGDTPGERRYMEQLAPGLNLPSSLTSRLDAEARSAAT